MPQENQTIDIESASHAVAVRQPQGVGAATAPEEIATAAPKVTAAQAKVEAIAALTMKAYERAASLVLTDDEIAKLSEEFPDEAFKPGAAGKENLIYIEHAFLRDRLNQVFKPGQWAIVPRNRWAEDFSTNGGKPASRVYVEAMLIIRGCFVSEAVGEMEYYPHNSGQNYGDAVEGAKTAALRRCCKELGVGLQPWKKDWCEGWWARKTVRRNENRAQTGSGATLTTGVRSYGGSATQAKADAKPSATAPANTTTPDPKPWPQTAKTLEWLIANRLDKHPAALDYFHQAGMLMPNEELKDLGLQWLPLKEEDWLTMKAAIVAFVTTGEAKRPYASRPVPVPRGTPAPGPKPKPEESAPPATPTANPNAREAHLANRKDPEWWRDVIVPIPHKGQRRADYIENPDTIGSLYDQMKSGTETAGKRLWGFVGHFEPKPWVGRDGVARPASDTDRAFRAALDAFAEWHERNGGDTDPVEAEERNAIDNL